MRNLPGVLVLGRQAAYAEPALAPGHVALAAVLAAVVVGYHAGAAQMVAKQPQRRGVLPLREHPHGDALPTGEVILAHLPVRRLPFEILPDVHRGCAVYRRRKALPVAVIEETGGCRSAHTDQLVLAVIGVRGREMGRSCSACSHWHHR